MLTGGSAAEGRNGAFSGVEPAAKRREGKLQTEAQRVSRFDAPSVTSATGMERSGHGRGEGGPVNGERNGGGVGHGGSKITCRARMKVNRSWCCPVRKAGLVWLSWILRSG